MKYKDSIVGLIKETISASPHFWTHDGKIYTEKEGKDGQHPSGLHLHTLNHLKPV